MVAPPKTAGQSFTCGGSCNMRVTSPVSELSVLWITEQHAEGGSLHTLRVCVLQCHWVISSPVTLYAQPLIPPPPHTHTHICVHTEPQMHLVCTGVACYLGYLAHRYEETSEERVHNLLKKYKHAPRQWAELPKRDQESGRVHLAWHSHVTNIHARVQLSHASVRLTQDNHVILCWNQISLHLSLLGFSASL